jgi:lycopene cyclase domain-containing protein
LNTHYTYCIILAASVAGPLALSFDKKVAFYTKWKFVFPAMIFPAVFYIVWDIFFTAKGVWSFNEDYITGIKLYNLPVEEVLFFFIVPYCCVFIYECIDCYFPQLKSNLSGTIVLQFTGLVLLIAGMVFYKKYYTGWTFIFNAVFIAIILSAKKYFKSFKASVFAVAYCIILIPFLIVNGFLTAIPVVLYNDAENLGLRIYTIPFEDVFYGMLLIMMNIVIYEKLRSAGMQPHQAANINLL